MARIQQSIDIGVPAHIAYLRLTQFEDYPCFMDEVESVRRLDDTHLHWTTRMANRSVEWDAEITERDPDHCIAWRNTSGPTNTGRVEVQEAGPDASRVICTIESAPEQVPGSMAGESGQDMEQRLRLDMARMKDFIEQGEAPRDMQEGRGSPRNAPVPTASYAAGSEGFSGEEEAQAPVASAPQKAAEQRNDSAGSVRQGAARVATAAGAETGRGEFPADRPLDALRADHHLVRQLFERYFQAQEAAEKRDLGTHVLLLLEMHTSLEEGVFYPRVRDADPALIERCIQEHAQAGQMIATLRRMDESDPQAVQTFHQLADAIFRHVDTEEQQLFPKIAQAGLDLGAIGREMRDFETRLIAGRLQKPAAPGMRQ
jgi:hemerythrin superfamily protein